MSRVTISRSMQVVALGVALTIGGLACAQTKQAASTATREVKVQRFSVVSARPFSEVVARIQSGVGHPDVGMLVRKIGAAKSESELESTVNAAVGPTGLMQFNQFDLGEVLRKDQGDKATSIVRLLVGNPLIMKQMVKYAPDAGSYAPVTILIDERADGVHLSYDTMESFLAPYQSKEASEIAKQLDAKIERLIQTAAF